MEFIMATTPQDLLQREGFQEKPVTQKKSGGKPATDATLQDVRTEYEVVQCDATLPDIRLQFEVAF
jgi:hypothetical protein